MILVLMLAVFMAAIILSLLSVWTRGRVGYQLIVALFTVGFVLDSAHTASIRGGWNFQTIYPDICGWMFFFYLITVQSLTGREISNLASRETYKDYLVENGRYSGFAKLIYYLPIFLVVFAVGGAAYLKSIGAH